MSKLGTKHTLVELAVRRELHAAGMRYRLHTPVPGLPRRTIDIAFVGVKVAVFIDGCFWHGCPVHGSIPRSNTEWWADKLRRNSDRDTETGAHLQQHGWQVLRFWEHEDPADVARAVQQHVSSLRQKQGAHVETDHAVDAPANGTKLSGVEASQLSRPRSSGGR